MLKILFAFFPWFIYSALLGNSATQNRIAIIAALIAVIIFDRKDLRKGFIFAWGTAIFFIALLIISFLTKDEWIIKNGNFISNIALAVIVWLSILINKPFSLQYARDTTSKLFWYLPGFIRINRAISIAWGIALIVSTMISVLQFYFVDVNSDYFQILSFAPLVLAFWFTSEFPKWYRARLVEKRRRAFAKVPHPFLSGNYAPVHDELDVANLTVIGKIPEDLNGVYMRNGPNPAFPPISYTFPLDGDGMIHAVYIEDGQARYKNRFVETKGLLAERRAGRAIYGGLLMPIPINTKYIGKDGDPGPVKDGAFIHIMRHANQYLALWEAGPAYQLERELNTIGEWSPQNGKRPFDVNPHFRVDPKNNHLSMFTYAFEPPYLTYYLLDAEGKLIKELPIEKPNSTFMHDLTATENYIVFFDCPAVYNFRELGQGKPFLQWKPELGARIGLLNKQTYETAWFETEPFFLYHFANAFEKEDQVYVDYVRYKALSYGKQKVDIPHLYRTVINLKTKTVSHYQMDNSNVEFPRQNEMFNTKPYRYTYLPSRIDKVYSAIIQFDLEAKTPNVHNFGPYHQVDEAVFVPRQGATEENDGYVMLYVYNKQENNSELVILDGQNFTDEPIARIKMPRRIPHGLHGSWMPNCLI